MEVFFSCCTIRFRAIINVRAINFNANYGGYSMINEKENLFILETKNTSYLFYVDELGLLQHLYYGSQIDLSGDALLAL